MDFYSIESCRGEEGRPEGETPFWNHYTLQSNKAVFNQFQVVATCPRCKLAAEDRHHFVLECPTLDLIRSKYMPIITQLIPDFTSFNRDQQLSTILDTHPDLKCRSKD